MNTRSQSIHKPLINSNNPVFLYTGAHIAMVAGRVFANIKKKSVPTSKRTAGVLKIRKNWKRG
jgi:hypothetical protein